MVAVQNSILQYNFFLHLQALGAMALLPWHRHESDILCPELILGLTVSDWHVSMHYCELVDIAFMLLL